jgi:hypothetical protein
VTHIIPDPVRGRHAYRDPSPRAHLLSATVRPAELPGHRITLATPTPAAAVAPLPGPADLSLTDRSPVIAVQAPGGWRVVHRLADSLFAALMPLHRTAARLRAAFDSRAEALRRYLELREWEQLPHQAQLTGWTHARALTELGPDTVRRAIVARALAVVTL